MGIRAQLRPVAYYVDDAVMALHHQQYLSAADAVHEAVRAGHSRQHIEACIRGRLFDLYGPAATKHVAALNAGLQEYQRRTDRAKRV